MQRYVRWLKGTLLTFQMENSMEKFASALTFWLMTGFLPGEYIFFILYQLHVNAKKLIVNWNDVEKNWQKM